MVETLAGKSIVVVGGSSGIGYAVAKASLLSQASHVTIVCTSNEKGARSVERLREDVAKAGVALSADVTITHDTVDAHDLASVRAMCQRVGEVDHFVWTSGDGLRSGFPQTLNLDENRGACGATFTFTLGSCADALPDAFDVRFWGAAQAAQSIKIKQGGSIIFTIGGSTFFLALGVARC